MRIQRLILNAIAARSILKLISGVGSLFLPSVLQHEGMANSGYKLQADAKEKRPIYWAKKSKYVLIFMNDDELPPPG